MGPLACIALLNFGHRRVLVTHNRLKEEEEEEELYLTPNRQMYNASHNHI